MKLSEDYKLKCENAAIKTADWLCNVQYPFRENNPSAGLYPWYINADGHEYPAYQWNVAFAIMGLLGVAEHFKNPRYEHAALRMGKYLKTLQIFDPFNQEHYGAIRECTPMTSWCFTRDALSAAWGFLALYEYTRDAEYLQRAILWAEWFFLKGLDSEGWPIWGIQFEPYLDEMQGPQMLNDIQGCFQGGSLNFLYHLARVTGNNQWTGKHFTAMADILVNHIQQPSGHFVSIDRKTKKVPSSDPQSGLHRTNDDLNSLGLLCAYKITGNSAYLNSIEKYLNAVFAGQLEDGAFDSTSIASIPVILNIFYEAGDLVNISFKYENTIEKALDKLISRQSSGRIIPRMAGGFEEFTNDQAVCARSSCYSLIYLTKASAGLKKYLSV